MTTEAKSPPAAQPSVDWLHDFIGSVVCADIGDGFQVFGTLSKADAVHLLFTEVDLHDLRDANSDRDHYASETAALGVRVNRQRLAVPRQRLIALSALVDIC